MVFFRITIMEYFAVQVKTRGESKYIKLFQSIYKIDTLRVHFPQRRLPIKSQGLSRSTLAPVFPGYIFIETEGKIDPDVYWALRRTDGFYRFLQSNQNVQPLSGQDLEIVLHFIQVGPVAETSKVYFNEEDRIVVSEGPLKGLEGRIIKVDKRKGRAKIKLDFYDNSFAIDLAFEIISRV
jgi:transcriptional antiterminator NusG